MYLWGKNAVFCEHLKIHFGSKRLAFPLSLGYFMPDGYGNKNYFIMI